MAKPPLSLYKEKGPGTGRGTGSPKCLSAPSGIEMPRSVFTLPTLMNRLDLASSGGRDKKSLKLLVTKISYRRSIQKQFFGSDVSSMNPRINLLPSIHPRLLVLLAQKLSALRFPRRKARHYRNSNILILYTKLAIITPNSIINISPRIYVAFLKFWSSKAKTTV
jgi:hypothetical protein